MLCRLVGKGHNMPVPLHLETKWHYAILAQGAEGGEEISPTLPPRENSPLKMEEGTVLRVEIEHNGKTRRYDNTAGHTLVMGRSAKADYPLDEMGASNNHAEVEATSEGLRVKDCSQNGTGYVIGGGPPVRMAKGV